MFSSKSLLKEVLQADLLQTSKSDLMKLTKDVLCELISHLTSTRASSPPTNLDNPVISTLQTLSDDLKQQMIQCQESIAEIARKNEESIIHKVENLLQNAVHLNDSEVNLYPSPHNAPSVLGLGSHLHPFPDPVTHHEENFLGESSADELLTFCKNCSFDDEGGHSIVSFGEQYSYSSATRTTPAPLPEPITKLISDITTHFPDCPVPNACLINRFTGPDAFLPEHSDDETSIDPSSTIFTVSLGSSCTIKFKGLHSGDETEHQVNSKSLYIMSTQSQSFWSHRIENTGEIDGNDFERYSITLRTTGRKFTRSTIILGDSNTRYLLFGEGKGTFGFNMPGNRVYTPRLEHINPVDSAGYSNIFIHCGINDLKNSVPPADCFGKLVSKIEAIRLVSPRARITVSPILPTKSHYLNKMALSFNECLFNYVYSPSSTRVQCLNFNAFCNDEGSLEESLGRYQCPDELIHLGKNGFRLLAGLMKDCVMSGKVDGRSYSSVASVSSRSARGLGERVKRVEVSSGVRRVGNINMMMKPPTTSYQQPASSRQQPP